MRDALGKFVEGLKELANDMRNHRWPIAAAEVEAAAEMLEHVEEVTRVYDGIPEFDRMRYTINDLAAKAMEPDDD